MIEKSSVWMMFTNIRSGHSSVLNSFCLLPSCMVDWKWNERKLILTSLDKVWVSSPNCLLAFKLHVDCWLISFSTRHGQPRYVDRFSTFMIMFCWSRAIIYHSRQACFMWRFVIIVLLTTLNASEIKNDKMIIYVHSSCIQLRKHKSFL